MAIVTPSQQPLLEADASETDEVSLTGKSAVAMILKMRGKSSEMIALYFEHREQAEQLHAWLKGEREQQQLRLKTSSIPFANITTAFDFPNHRIVRNLGVVSGLTVRAADPSARLTSGLKSLIGGSLGSLIELCETARNEARSKMLREALQLEANAIAGFRYDSNDVIDGATEVLCYGTAVFIEPLDQNSDVNDATS